MAGGHSARTAGVTREAQDRPRERDLRSGRSVGPRRKWPLEAGSKNARSGGRPRKSDPSGKGASHLCRAAHRLAPEGMRADPQVHCGQHGDQEEPLGEAGLGVGPRLGPCVTDPPS